MNTLDTYVMGLQPLYIFDHFSACTSHPTIHSQFIQLEMWIAVTIPTSMWMKINCFHKILKYKISNEIHNDLNHVNVNENKLFS